MSLFCRLAQLSSIAMATVITSLLGSCSQAFAASDNSDALRAIELCKQGKTREALPLFDRALRISPGDAQLFYNRGLAYQRLGETDKSIKDYSKSLNLSPLNKDAYLNRSQAYLKKREYALALRDLDKVIGLNRSDARAYSVKGNVWAASEHYKNAMKEFDKSIEIAPSATAYICRANTEQRLGLFTPALIDYNEALKIDSSGVKALCNRAQFYLCREKYEQAINDAAKYIAQKGWSDEYSHYAAFVQLIAARLSKREDVEIKVKTDMLANKPPDEWTYKIAEYMAGKISAQELLTDAENDQDNLTEAHAYIGLSLYCANKIKEANSHFQWIVSSGNPLFDEFTIAKNFLEKKVKRSGQDARAPGIRTESTPKRS